MWGELEFVLPEDKVVRLHGTEWTETQQFHRHLDAHWRRWSQEMSDVAAQALQEQWARISERTGENQWLTRERVRDWNTKFARPLPPCRYRSHGWRNLITVARYGVSVWRGYRTAREAGSSTIRRMLMPCWKRMPTFLPR
ncbi:helicase IV [Salmonella enterica subsp. arizonae]|nr:helicase IV [Salmonella enterica subsp. arizonae]